MKTISLLLLGTLTTSIAFSQSSRSSTQMKIENGKVEKWTITEKYDADGNLVDYDSTYIVEDSPSSSNSYSFDFYNGPSYDGLDDSLERDFFSTDPGPFGYNFDFFFNDSSFQRAFGDDSFNMDTTLFYGFGPNNFFNLDSLLNNQEDFSKELEELLRKYGINPSELNKDRQENSPGDLPKGERI